MPGIISENVFLPSFPNIWPYNTANFINTPLGTKLLMSNKLVHKAKRSIFSVISVGPRPGEAVYQWEIRVANVQHKLEQHKMARDLLQQQMYSLECQHLNGDA